MKLIIAGGRKYKLTGKDHVALNSIEGVREVVSGCARGADTSGELWAKRKGLKVSRFPADWANIDPPDAFVKTRADGSKYNARAGFDRNQRMADYADAVALFPGGSGTEDMRSRAKKSGLDIYEMG